MKRLLLIVVGLYGLNVCAQTHELSVTAPQSGTIVHPGDVVTFIVAKIQGSPIDTVAIVGPAGPVGVVGSISVTSGGGQLSFTVPPSTKPGQYQFAAVEAKYVNVLNPPSSKESSPVILRVEGSGIVSSLILVPAAIKLRFPGDRVSGIRVTGVGSDGSHMDLTESSRLAVSSTDENIVRLTPNGIVGWGAGSADIQVQYQNADGSFVRGAIHVTVPALIRGDLNGDGRVNSTDLQIMTSYRNTSALCPNDARDLNHDGKIDALDARILVTLFTNPRGTP